MSSKETALLFGGCFWGIQDLVRRLPSVNSTRVGYSDVANAYATHRNHGTHGEALEVVFGPARTSWRALLEFFFLIHNPSTPNRQGNDGGCYYRSGIYYKTPTSLVKYAVRPILSSLPCRSWTCPGFTDAIVRGLERLDEVRGRL